jgi:glycerate kinase
MSRQINYSDGRDFVMRVLLAPDSFKGSLASVEAVRVMDRGLRHVFPDAETVPFPMADGGEGTARALREIIGGQDINVSVTDPLGRKRWASYLWVAQQRLAVIETASASGLPLLAEQERDPARASSYGTGLLIRHALDQGTDTLILGLGGSATVDGGMGLLRALGARFTDSKGEELMGDGASLLRVAQADLTGLDPRLRRADVILATDVENPLLGPEGAVSVFGPQKGMQSRDIPAYEAGMSRYADVMRRVTGRDERHAPGSGAAGGIGFGLLSCLGCRRESGFDLIASQGGLMEKMAEVDLVFTGEGCFDSQSFYGKVPVSIGRMAKRLGVPVIAFAGRIEGEQVALPDVGISLLVPIVDKTMSLAEALDQAELLLEKAVWRVATAIKLGRGWD